MLTKSVSCPPQEGRMTHPVWCIWNGPLSWHEKSYLMISQFSFPARNKIKQNVCLYMLPWILSGRRRGFMSRCIAKLGNIWTEIGFLFYYNLYSCFSTDCRRNCQFIFFNSMHISPTKIWKLIELLEYIWTVLVNWVTRVFVMWKGIDKTVANSWNSQRVIKRIIKSTYINTVKVYWSWTKKQEYHLSKIVWNGNWNLQDKCFKSSF